MGNAATVTQSPVVTKNNHGDCNTRNGNNIVKKKKEEEPLFIHGRHSCDACFVAPIVGNRYRAPNIPNYDLCEKCHNNRARKEIRYEVVHGGHEITPGRHTCNFCFVTPIVGNRYHATDLPDYDLCEKC